MLWCDFRGKEEVVDDDVNNNNDDDDNYDACGQFNI